MGILQVELGIDWATSLKDKRRVVTSLKDRLHRAHLVSVAEVETQDDHHVATLGITLASNSVPHVQSVLDTILAQLAEQRDCVLRNHAKEILTGR
ncbi:MAG: DUF503 domain-containing protein [Phycisphaeraceae bacterium]|nr:DUF503 domain-containing protein [Phycisphaeraceae bacterium]